MKVYSVLGSIPYEGDDLLGVFVSREDAMAFISKQPEHHYHQYGVLESELGQPVEVDAMADWL